MHVMEYYRETFVTLKFRQMPTKSIFFLLKILSPFNKFKYSSYSSLAYVTSSSIGRVLFSLSPKILVPNCLGILNLSNPVCILLHCPGVACSFS